MAYDGAYMFMMVLICQPVLLLCFFSWFVLLDEDGFLFCSCIFWLSLFLWVCSCRMLQRSKRSGLRCCTPNGKKSKHRKSHDRKSKIETKDMQSIATNIILVYQCICVCVCPSFLALPWASGTWLKKTVLGQKMHHPVQDWHSHPSQKLSQPHSTWRFLLQSSWCTRASCQTPAFKESTWKSRTNLPEVKDVATPQSRLLQISYWGCPFPLKKSPTLTLSPRFLSNGTGLTKQLSVRMPAIQIVENPNWIFHLAEQTVPLFSFDVSSIYIYIHVLIFSLNIGLTINDTYGICTCKIRLNSTAHIV